MLGVIADAITAALEQTPRVHGGAADAYRAVVRPRADGCGWY